MNFYWKLNPHQISYGDGNVSESQILTLMLPINLIPLKFEICNHCFLKQFFLWGKPVPSPVTPRVTKQVPGMISVLSAVCLVLQNRKSSRTSSTRTPSMTALKGDNRQMFLIELKEKHQQFYHKRLTSW